MLRYVSAWLLYPLAERHQGRQIRAKVATLRRHMAGSFAERMSWARTRLASSLARAGADVPYYRDLFHKLGFDPAKLGRDLAYLEDLPYLTKDIIREQGPRLLSTQFQPGELHVRKTGGSTGPSTLIYYSQEALDWTAAVNVVALEWAGKRPHMLEMHLASRFPEQFPWRDRLKERVKSLVLNRVNLFTDSFDPPALDAMWQRIRRERPYLIQGHPSTLYALATRLRDQQVGARGAFQIFESTGEVLDPRKREVIESVFACRAIDRYGNAEFGVLAYERLRDSAGRMSVFDGIAWPEIADHDGQSELVFTALRNDAMPLVRYRTGDLADLISTPEGFSIGNVCGRVHDLVRIGAHSYPTHYLQDLLDRIGGIDEFQVEQRSSGSSLLRLVVPDAAQRDAVSLRVRQWWGDDVQLEFTDFDGLVRGGWRNKFRYLVDAAPAA